MVLKVGVDRFFFLFRGKLILVVELGWREFYKIMIGSSGSFKGI